MARLVQHHTTSHDRGRTLTQAVLSPPHHNFEITFQPESWICILFSQVTDEDVLQDRNKGLLK